MLKIIGYGCGAVFFSVGAMLSLLLAGQRGELRLLGSALFLGAGAAFFAYELVRIYRGRVVRGAVVDVDVPGGVPFQASTRQRLGIGVLGLSMFGGAAIFGFLHGAPVMGGLSALLAGVGTFITIGTLWGFLPRPSLTFLPDGILVADGRGRDYRLLWDNIASVGAGEFSRSEAVFVNVRHVERLAVGATMKPAKIGKLVRWNRALGGADIILLMSLYGLGAESLARAIEVYVRHPEKRARLATGRLPQGG